MLLSRTSRRVRAIAVAVGLSCWTIGSASYAVSLPFFEDFSGTAPDFTNTAAAGATWAVNPGGAGVLRLSQTAQASALANSASVSVPTGLGAGDLAATDYFLASTSINVSAYTTTGANGIDIGLNLFGDDNLLTTAYRFDFNPTKQTFRIASTDTSPTGAFTFSTAETYTLSVKGWYDAGTLKFDFTFTDPSEALPITISASDATPLTGTNFGLRNRTGTGTGTSNNSVIDHDNFSINVVPEPSSIMLSILGLAIGGIAIRKQTKSA